MNEIFDYVKLQKLFSTYTANKDENSLKEIIRLTAPWLFNIIYQLLVDEDYAEKIINLTLFFSVILSLRLDQTSGSKPTTTSIGSSSSTQHLVKCQQIGKMSLADVYQALLRTIE